MSPSLRVILVGGAAVLAYDAVMAAASRAFGYPYGAAMVGSVVLYAAVGAFAARAGGSLGSGALAAAAVGVVDATLGWLLSAAIGPGRPAGEAAAPAAIAATVVFVAVLAGAFGLLGAVLGRFFAPGPPPPG